MKAREPRLKLDGIDPERIDVKQWIRTQCSNYSEAAQFFNVSEGTVKQWMAGTRKPNPPVAVAIAWYEKAKEIA
jgi:DNA-binding transcriptional regulator YiaG